MSSKKVSILFVHHFTGLGGATKSMYTLVQALDSSKYKAQILFLSKPGEASKLFEELNLPVYHLENIPLYPHAYGARLKYLSSRPLKPWIQWFKLRKSIPLIRAFLKDKEVDLIHLNTTLLLAFGMAAKEEGIKVIWHIRELLHPGLLGWRYYMIKRIILNCSDTIIAISKTNAKRLGRSSKIKVIYNYTKIPEHHSKAEAMAALPLPLKTAIQQKIVIVFLGGTVASKGLKVLIKATQQLGKRQDLLFVVAGYPAFRPYAFKSTYYKLKYLFLNKPPNDYCYELIDNGTFPENVIFTGFLKKVEPLLQCSDILIWPATEPHFARPIVEAMAHKVPVIATDFESSRELILKPKAGYLFPNKSHKKLAEQIDHVLNHPTEVQAIKIVAYDKAVQLYNEAKNFKDILKVYENV